MAKRKGDQQRKQPKKKMKKSKVATPQFGSGILSGSASPESNRKRK